MEYHHYIGIGGAGLVVIALLLGLAGGRAIKVSATVIGIFGGLAVGLGLGILGMTLLGYEPPYGEMQQKAVGAAPAVEGKDLKAPGPGGKVGGGQKAKGGGKGGFKGPSAKAQLGTLVTKLEQLTTKPLSLELKPDQKKRVAELVKDLGAMETLEDIEAQSRLDGLLNLLDEHRPTLEAAGFRWPGAGFGGGMADPPNPFQAEPLNAKLKALQESLKQ